MVLRICIFLTATRTSGPFCEWTLAANWRVEYPSPPQICQRAQWLTFVRKCVFNLTAIDLRGLRSVFFYTEIQFRLRWHAPNTSESVIIFPPRWSKIVLFASYVWVYMFSVSLIYMYYFSKWHKNDEFGKSAVICVIMHDCYKTCRYQACKTWAGHGRVS